MNSTSRLAAFAAGLAVIGGGAAAIGSATDATPPFQNCLDADGGPTTEAMSMAAAAQEESGASAAVVTGSDGSRSRLGGLSLKPINRSFSPGRPAVWRFRIVDCNGDAVRKFERDQTKLLHLIVTRDDLTGYQHLHPTLAPDGTFSVAVTFKQPGRYRAITDFTTGGKRYVLGTDLTAPGDALRTRLPAPATTATVDGYTVSLGTPAALVAGHESQLTFRITRAGKPVRTLQPYLGAYGHLVALRAADLTYSHVHPVAENARRGAITFDAELHEAGAYRLFVQFRAGGRVHTAAFTQHATD